MYLPEAIIYDAGDVRYVVYADRTLSVYDYRKEAGELYAGTPERLHELLYLIIQSRVGELLDRAGMHRVHALGLARGKTGILCILPQGGGKTTLGLELLKRKGISFLSDDTPLISRNGTLFPFPLRIGVCEGYPLSVPEQFLSRMVRQKYGAKTLIDIAYFKEKIGDPVPARVIIIGERELSRDARIEEASRASALSSLFACSVVGLGLPQMVEYFLRTGSGSLLRKAPLVMSRCVAVAAAVSRARVYRLVLGTDIERNGNVLAEFIERLPGGKDA
jgi:hypothetical protein